jgi:DtxR family Mn-dependent transcriptional regulator
MAEPAQSAALSESLQDYVEAVYLLVQRHGVARMRDIAGLVGVGKSSATGAIRALAERGLVNYDPYQYVTLTGKGEAAGREVARRHRILKQFLTEVLAVPEAEAEGVACKMEHAIKGAVLARFVRFLQFVEQQSESGGSWAEAFDAFCESAETGEDAATGARETEGETQP